MSICSDLFSTGLASADGKTSFHKHPAGLQLIQSRHFHAELLIYEIDPVLGGNTHVIH
jgi:hypothetical protein